MTEDVYTEEVEGHEVVGVLFNPKNGKFYEFQDPDTHDKWCQLECPRSGDVLEFDNFGQEAIAVAVNGYLKASIPVDNWMEFRDLYLNSDEGEFDGWSEKWREMAREDPRFEYED